MRTLVCALALAAAAARSPAQTPERPSQAASGSPAPACVLRDTLGGLPRGDGEAMLNNFAATLAPGPRTTAYIIAYGGRRWPRGGALARPARTKRYPVGKRGIDAGRIVTIDGGYREEAAAELRAVPADAPPPVPAPTVAASDVEFTDRRAGRVRRKQARAGRSSGSE